MKKVLMIALAVAHFAFAGAQVKPENPKMAKMGLTATQLAHYMAPGVNLGNTMEACNWNDIFTNNAGLKSETSWQNDKTTESYIRSLKQQGFNSLRIPTSWVAGHLTDKENMTIDPVWMKRIKEIVNYGLNAGLCVIINEHWDGGWMEHDAFTNQVNVSEHKEMYRKLWGNIANQFRWQKVKCWLPTARSLPTDSWNMSRCSWMPFVLQGARMLSVCSSCRDQRQR